MATQPGKKRRVERKRSRPWYLARGGKLNLSILTKPVLVLALGSVVTMLLNKVLEPPPVGYAASITPPPGMWCRIRF